jgi:predicted AAA+ superfamily ATPase
MELLNRDFYLKQLESVRGIPDIKLITGVRGCGKAALMDAFAARLAAQGVKVIRISFDLSENLKFAEEERLYAFLQGQWQSGRKHCLIIDEAQQCKEIAQIACDLQEEGRFDLYLTASDAAVFADDRANALGGRVFEISVFPLAFDEYLQGHLQAESDCAFEDYLKDGGMPGAYGRRMRKAALEYVRALYEGIVRDAAARGRLQQEDLLFRIGRFLLNNAGSALSARKAAAAVKSNDRTAEAYIRLLCQALLFYRVPRFDLKSGRTLKSGLVYYPADPAFYSVAPKDCSVSSRRLYENLIVIELLRRGFALYAGRLYGEEIGFVAVKHGRRVYVKVADDVSGAGNLKREIAPLLSIRDAYPKLLIARTRHETADYEGVQVADIARWLAVSQK